MVSKLVAHYAADAERRQDLARVLDGLTFAEGRDSPGSKLIWNLMGSATLQISEELCNEAADLVAQDLNEAEYRGFSKHILRFWIPLQARSYPVKR